MRLEAIEQLMGMALSFVDVPPAVTLSDELIALEQPEEAYVSYEEPLAKPAAPSGPAFHEKSDKNTRRREKKVRKAERMKLKYGKPKTRGQKVRGKKKKR